MKGKPVEQLVYEYMFPKPRPADPQSFTFFLQRHLVLEVRQEVHAFYGHLETPEAKYPGLDYTNRTHRIRLSRWPWHRRLFRAFDGLRLTPNEIAGLTKWEGTRWAKERYEKEQGITIVDTTEDDISHPESSSTDRATSEEQTFADPGEGGADETMAEDSDEELASVGFDLNQRLRERVALRNVSGDMSMVIDEEWERWLKDAIETGQLPEIASRIYRETGEVPETVSRLYEETQQQQTRASQEVLETSAEIALMDPMVRRAMMAAAREGRWEEVPERYRIFLPGRFHDGDGANPRRAANGDLGSSSFGHDFYRLMDGARTRSPLAGEVSSEPAVSRPRLPPQHRRQHWSNLRLPSGDGGDTPSAGWLGLLPGA